MKVTRDDVARLAGVSTATVSYVVNNSRGVSERVRQRVLDAVTQLNYRPNFVAKSLASNRTWQLALAVNDIANPFYGEMVLGFEAAARRRGYFVNIISGAHDLDDHFQLLADRRIDGIFVAALPIRFSVDRLYDLDQHGISVVVSGNVGVDPERVSSIENDYETAMSDALAYLNRMGHERVAYLSGLRRDMSFDARAHSYLSGAPFANGILPQQLYYEADAPWDTSISDGEVLAAQFVKDQRIPPDSNGLPATAVICTNGLMALGAYRTFKLNGIRIPEDVSLIAFDNIFAEELVEPPLTCFDMHKAEFGAKALEILLAHLDDGSRIHHINSMTLVERGSVARRTMTKLQL